MAPDGAPVVRVTGTEGLVVGSLDHRDPCLDGVLEHARPWRARARAGEIYVRVRVVDERTAARTAF